MTLEEIKKLDNSFWLNFLKEKSKFDVDKIEAMIQFLIEKAETNEAAQRELEYRLLNNFINHMTKVYRERNCNWVIVQRFLQQGTSKAGSNSSREKCTKLGIDPWGYTLKREE